jgi:hypothetical protein
MSWRLWSRRSQSGFAAAMAASFPEELTPPRELLEFFEWQEAEGLDAVEGDLRYARFDPDQPYLNMYTMPVDPRYAETWYRNADESVRGRIAPFLRSGGDGSVVALWRDNAGDLAFVHMGSGSGSTLLSVLTREPIDFLKLIAIGYDELCWPEWYARTPEQAYADAFIGVDDRLYRPRERLRAWVEKTFDVVVPATASTIVTQVSHMDDAESEDEFWNWDRSLQGWGLMR